MTLYKENGRIMATGVLKHLKKKGKTIYWAKTPANELQDDGSMLTASQSC